MRRRKGWTSCSGASRTKARAERSAGAAAHVAALARSIIPDRNPCSTGYAAGGRWKALAARFLSWKVRQLDCHFSVFALAARAPDRGPFWNGSILADCLALQGAPVHKPPIGCAHSTSVSPPTGLALSKIMNTIGVPGSAVASVRLAPTSPLRGALYSATISPNVFRWTASFCPA